MLTGARATRRFRKGFRYGEGPVAAVVRPATLLAMWRALQVCNRHDCVIIMQAANTGLTGGSTPWGDGYDGPVVVINAMRLRGIRPILGGDQVVTLPGATLDQLEKALRPLGREPHSVIGSSCIGASVAGGVCNNSGGALIRRGPAYTELALYARRDADGALRLVNHLGIALGETPEEILSRLDRGDLGAVDGAGNRWASDREYHAHVRQVDEAGPARFNADPRRLHEASGSAGKLAVFALRLDTFPADEGARVFCIGVDDPAELTALRRHILTRFEHLPVAGEYLHRDGYDLAKRYGKDLFLLIKRLGTDRVAPAFALKAWIDGLTERLGLGGAATDRIVQGAVDLLPSHLPRRLERLRDRHEHMLLLKMDAAGAAEARAHLGAIFPSSSGEFFECEGREGEDCFLHRFAFGGAAGRYRALHRHAIEDVLALDVALPRNLPDWAPDLPPEHADAIAHVSVCAHFFCHVFHIDYMIRKGADPEAVKKTLLERLRARGAEYPAEHNVGHVYEAGAAQTEFWRRLDPGNRFNPGIGRTSRAKDWA